MARLLMNLSARERRLAAITGGIALAFVLAVAGVAIRAHLSSLDDRIGQLENELLNVTAQVAAKERVDREFDYVITQHGSPWTLEEIHTNLRREIYRLALRMPPPPGLEPPTRGEGLVTIPSLAQGALSEDPDEGYREYRVQVNVPAAPVPEGIRFLERLLTSPQMLRIEHFELLRDPMTPDLARFTYDVTRTVINVQDPALRDAIARRSSDAATGSGD